AVTPSHEADVIALTKLTCLMLLENSTLLQPKSIWAAKETHERLAMVKCVLQLELIDMCIKLFLYCFVFVESLFV
ncbi:hypothetical protein MKX01_020071, partial [Papaver californicum]